MSQKTTPEETYSLISTDPQFRVFYDMMRKIESESVPKDEWMFTSSSLFSSIVNTIIRSPADLSCSMSEKENIEGDFRVLWVHYIWAKSRGIYRFDEDLLKTLAHTDIEYPIPSQVFDAIPEPCTVIRVPTGYFEEGYQYIYAMIERHPEKEDHLLIILHDGEDAPVDDRDFVFYSFPFQNRKFDIKNLLGDILNNPFFLEKYGSNLREDSREAMQIMERVKLSMQRVIPMLLYMCEYQPDIERVTPEKAIRSDPGRAIKYAVGIKAGTVLRAHKKVYVRDGHIKECGKEKAPHYRRPYFRIQNYGPRPKPGEPDRRDKRTIWIHGTFVNKDRLSEEDRPVRKITYMGKEK